VTNTFYSDLSNLNSEKISNCMLQLLGTTTALVLCTMFGFWELLFAPMNYENPSPTQAHYIAVGQTALVCCLIPTYCLELAFDSHLRNGLAMHHLTVITLTLWAVPVIFSLHGDVFAVRAFFALSLYPCSEQNVLMEMLIYHRKVYCPRLYYASAMFYVIMRCIIAVLNFWAWLGMFDPVFNLYDHNSGLVYALWLSFVPANAMFIFTQIRTAVTLFGIADSVKKKVFIDDLVSNRPSTGSNMSTDSMSCACWKHDLSHISRVIDFDLRGCITLYCWREHIGGMKVDVVLPLQAIDKTFEAMDKSKRGRITYRQFEDYFRPLLIRTVDFELVLLAVILKVAIEGKICKGFGAALKFKHSEIMTQIREQHVHNRAKMCRKGDSSFQRAWVRLTVGDLDLAPRRLGGLKTWSGALELKVGLEA